VLAWRILFEQQLRIKGEKSLLTACMVDGDYVGLNPPEQASQDL
jgi:hypothetical protein